MLGGSGQLGSRISDHLILNGFQIVSRTKPPASPGSLAPDTLSVRKLLDLGPLDLVVSASSPNSKTARNNTTATLQWARNRSQTLRDFASASPSTQGVYLSSVQVYGSHPAGEITETSPLVVDSAYGAMHQILEDGLRSAANWNILRLANMFGPPGRGGTVSWELFTHDLVRTLVKNQVGMVHGNPEIRRDFLPTSTLENAISWLFETKVSGLFNLTSGISIGLGEWAKRVQLAVESQTGERSRIQFETKPGLKSSFRISNEKIASCGFSGFQSIEDELKSLASFAWEQEG